MKKIWQYALKYALPHWYLYLTGLIALALTNWLTLKIPQFAKTIVNQISIEGSTTSLQNIAISIIGLGFLQVLIRSLSRILIFWPGRKLEELSKNDLFKNLNQAKSNFFQNHGLGDLISRISHDVNFIRVLFAFGFLMFFNLVFLGLFIIHQMFATHATLAFLSLLPLTLMFVIAKYGMPKMHELSLANQVSVGQLTNRVTETLINVHTIQAYAAGPVFLDRINEESRAVYDSNIKLVFIQTLLWPLISTLASISQVVVLFYGASQILKGNLTTGDILVFNAYIGYLAFPLTAIGILFSIYQRSKSALDRISEVEDSPKETRTVPLDKETPAPSAPLIRAKNLNFSFTEGEFKIKNISLEVNPGDRIGVFGRIGSGKSTLFKLMTKLLEPSPEMIFLHDQDVLHCDVQNLRNSLFYLEQVPHLFSDTIQNNIALNLSVGLEEIYEASKKAGIQEEVLLMPKKWGTLIGERGIRLSGGQKQRLCLARAFLRKAEIYLLDDPLSAVDQKKEREILKEIDHSLSSFLFVSHRLTPFELCNRIIIIENGEITEEGRFQDLLPKLEDLSKKANE